MKDWSSWRTALFGVVLIAATNAVVLLGVAYNRSGDAESLLTLGKREFARIGEWGFGREDSGLTLRLHWRTPGGTFPFYGSGVDEEVAEGVDGPAWVDRARLAALGFDLPDSLDETKRQSKWQRQQSRPAMVVLEFDGPAYQHEVERARRRAEEMRARAEAMPNDKESKRKAEGAGGQLARLENEETRLYVVDVGPDLAALRAKYPDRTRHAIVQAEIRPVFYRRKGVERLSAQVELTTANIMVPLEQRAAWEKRNGTGTQIQLAFGKRLEPWIVAIQAQTEAAR